MIRDNLRWLLLVGVLAVSSYSQATAHPLGAASAPEPSIITVQSWPGWHGAPGWQGQPGWSPDQGRREHCWRLRNRAREIRDRMYYAPPWERQRMERHLWDIQERARAEAWGRR